MHTIPWGVIGGVTIALYGLIGLIGGRIWMNKVDFANPVNMYTAAVMRALQRDEHATVADQTVDPGA